MDIQVKRIYEPFSQSDGYRVLVDRVWPRGIKKEQARLDEWLRSIAPSTELRKWFGHDNERFKEFAKRYKQELKGHRGELKRLKKIASETTLTLLYAAKNTAANQALVIQNELKNITT